ncbi:MAG: lysophospholipid acyltransferase family protein [Abditibacteriales bacterium]|nr:lysophospholipid acyltransferase family protein [Abditibacteriales bacterium]MDW8366305.1 lysophospholipid acyltransferase family protein [Abditibacteriales bacterium]
MDSTVATEPRQRGWRRAFLQYLRRYFVRSEIPWVKELRLYLLPQMERLFIIILAATYRIHCKGLDVFARLRQEGRGAVLVVWHDKTLVPAYLLQRRGYYALISRSRVGELQARTFQRLGWRVVRGSSGEGVAALRASNRILRQGHIVALTPDGPTGPRHRCQAGAIYLASLAQCPLVALGVAANPCKLLATWDRYMIPLPFARVAIVASEPFDVPSPLTKEQIEELTYRVGDLIERMEREAERLVR